MRFNRVNIINFLIILCVAGTAGYFYRLWDGHLEAQKLIKAHAKIEQEYNGGSSIWTIESVSRNPVYSKVWELPELPYVDLSLVASAPKSDREKVYEIFATHSKVRRLIMQSRLQGNQVSSEPNKPSTPSPPSGAGQR